MSELSSRENLYEEPEEIDRQDTLAKGPEFKSDKESFPWVEKKDLY